MGTQVLTNQLIRKLDLLAASPAQTIELVASPHQHDETLKNNS